MHEATTGNEMPDDEETINNTFDSPVTHNHYHTPEKSKEQPVKQGLSTLAKLAIGTGVGAVATPIAGASAMWLYDRVFSETEPTPIVEPIDTDTTVQIRLGKEGE